ncbi:MAG TPA: VOC family protein [Lachnospiraceae bacterium]|nr:VOC family protein [Lachnospiraceae bacterium]
MLKPDHITINVTDLEKSLDFYGRILGLKQLETVDMGDHRLYYFAITDSLRLELITYEDDFGEAHPHEKTRGLYRHLAFSCDSVDELYKRLKENGIDCPEPEDVKKLNFRNILVKDPNGVELEFITY